VPTKLKIGFLAAKPVQAPHRPGVNRIGVVRIDHRPVGRFSDAVTASLSGAGRFSGRGAV
jgi:hypothetical protein